MTPTESSATLLGSYRMPAGFPAFPADWEASSETFQGSTVDCPLFALRMKARSPSHPYRVLLVIHGQGEHGGRYLHMAHYLRPEISEIWALDLQGHGKSHGLRGHVAHFDDYVEDTAIFSRLVRTRVESEHAPEKNSEAVEFHLFGHSMGGLVALRLLLLHPDLGFASASVSAPLLELKMKVPTVKKLAAYGLASIWGSLQLASEMDVRTISRDEAVQKAYVEDRLVHDKATPKFFVELQKVMADTRSRKEGYPCPLQFVIPMKDELVDPEVVLEYAREIHHPRKELKTYADFRHESFNEIGKEAAFEDLKKWILANPQKNQSARPTKKTQTKH